MAVSLAIVIEGILSVCLTITMTMIGGNVINRATDG